MIKEAKKMMMFSISLAMYLTREYFMSLMGASLAQYHLENAMMMIGFRKLELKFRKELKNIHNLK
jgi:hypothetical protein